MVVPLSVRRLDRDAVTVEAHGGDVRRRPAPDADELPMIAPPPDQVHAPRPLPRRARRERPPPRHRARRRRPARGAPAGDARRIEADGGAGVDRRFLGFAQPCEPRIRVRAEHGRRGAPRPGTMHGAADMQRQVDRDRARRAPGEHVHGVVRHRDDRPTERDIGRCVADFGVDPARPAAIHEGQQPPVRGMLCPAVDQRCVVGDGRPIPEQIAHRVRSGAHVVEPPCVAVGKEQVQAIGVAVAAPVMAVVETEVDTPGVAPQDRESLRREQHRPRRARLERR